MESRNGPFTISIRSTNEKKEKEHVNESDTKQEKSSYFHALVNTYRATVGTGILALPYGFSQAGYIGGVLGTIAVTCLVNYCALLLAKCSLELRSRRSEKCPPTYQSTVKIAFEEGPKSLRPYSTCAQNVANLFLILGQFGGVCVYLIFISENIKQALGPYIEEYTGPLTIRGYILLIAIPVLAMNICLTLKKLSFVSSFGNIVLLISVICVLYYAIRDMAYTNAAKPFGTIDQMPAFIGTIFFATGCSSLVVTLQSEMKNPKELSNTFGVLNVNALISGTLYCIFGILGYLNFGPDSKASITLNLPRDDMLSKIIQLFLALSTMTCTAIQNYVTVTVLWEDYVSNFITKRETLIKICMRIGIVALTVSFALIMPKLGIVMSLVGIIAQSTIGTTFSCIIHILCHWEQPNFLSYIKAFWAHAIIILVVSFICFYSIISELKNAIYS